MSATSLPYLISYLSYLNPDLRVDYMECLYRYVSMVPSGGKIIEIGCYRGDSTAALLAGSDPSVSVLSVDPIFARGKWTYPDVNAGYLSVESNLDDVKNKLNPLGATKRWNVAPVTSEVALGIYADTAQKYPKRLSEIDFVLVDGEHTYEAVSIDCQWLEYVKSGGYAAFDDWMAPIEKAVKDYIVNKPEWSILYESTQAHRDGMCVTLLGKQ